MIDLHMREFDGTTFGMSVEASSPAYKRMKKRAFHAKIRPHGNWIERIERCVWAADVAAAMGKAGWLVSELKCMKTIRWGNDPTEHYIIYEEDNHGQEPND